MAFAADHASRTGRPAPHYLKHPRLESESGDRDVTDRVDEMLRDIKSGGPDAVRRWSLELDRWDPPSFLVSEEEFERAEALVDEELRSHIAFAQQQVRQFALAQLETMTDLRHESLPGIELGHRHIPVGSVGAYVPGGRYPMLASSFMTIVVAKAAGVEQVIACAPPQPGGGIHPAMLYAMWTSGADAVVALGGVQALAAMAYGFVDDALAPVDMLVGAGNAYVAEAKRQLFGVVGIDLLAGPTEILVIADDSADPRIVAADVLGQAEHGLTSAGGVIAIGEEVGRAVEEEIETLLETWPTAAVAGQAWRDFGWIAVVDDDDAAIALADDAADEHLEVQVAEDKLDMYLERLRNYGSLFLGEQATVAYGDKGIGTNHVLPTTRAARYTGGLWVGKFLKTCTWQRLDAEGTRGIAPTIEAICQAENMLGHGLTATLRRERAET